MRKLKISRRWLLGLASVAVIGVALFAFGKPAHAETVGGTAEPVANPNGSLVVGGVFTVTVDGTDVKVDSSNTSYDPLGGGASATASGINISPHDPGVQTSVSGGQINIKGVSPGKHTVTLYFRFTNDSCTNAASTLIGTVGAAFGGAGLSAFCELLSGQSYYKFTKVWTVDVVAGHSAVLGGGNDITSIKNIGTAIKVDANGNPVVECKNADILMKSVVCPIISSILGSIDWIVQNFIQPLLIISPLATKASDGSPSIIYNTWNNIRNVANLLFIVTFFVIVFSQATSIGITNYGIKRLLPRLILIAIFTNISFFVCSFFVDLFNILGTGAASLLLTTVVNGSPSISLGGDIIPALFGNSVVGDMAGIFASDLITTPIIFALFAFFIISLIVLVIAAIVVVIRQIVIVFLVIFSPLAFVAGLLPNTQKYFSQWFDMFLRMLAVYPILMLLFAAGKVASTIIGQIGN